MGYFPFALRVNEQATKGSTEIYIDDLRAGIMYQGRWIEILNEDFEHSYEIKDLPVGILGTLFGISLDDIGSEKWYKEQESALVGFSSNYSRSGSRSFMADGRTTLAAPNPSPIRESETKSIQTTASAQPDATGGTAIALFRDSGDLFKCSGKSDVSLDAGPTPGQKAMRWTVHYAREWEKCSERTDFPEATVRPIELWIKSDKDDFVMLRLVESGGESFYTLVRATPHWVKHAVGLSDFQLDPSGRTNGKLDLGAVELIEMAEGAGAEGAKGSRTIWFADIRFAGK